MKHNHLRLIAGATLAILSNCFFGVSARQDQVPANPMTAVRLGQDQKKATPINDSIFQAIGFGNTFLVTTGEGNVIIDTSMPFNASLHNPVHPRYCSLVSEAFDRVEVGRFLCRPDAEDEPDPD